MKNKTMITILGFTATLIGLGSTLLSDWVLDKDIDRKIEEKINEVLANDDEEEES